MAEAEEQDRRQDILDAALVVFSEEGYHKATIKQIARRAQLKSPALIYWYFENKEELLKAVLARIAPVITQATNPRAFMDRSPEDVLTLLATLFMASVEADDTRKLFRVFISEAIHTPEIVEYIAEGGPRIVLNALVDYLDHQIATGALRPHNPQSSARSFIGMLVIYLLGQVVLTPLADGFPPPDEYIRDIVVLFLHGMSAGKDESQ